MSSNPIRRVNIAAIACEPRPQLPDGFQRSSTRPGAELGHVHQRARVAGCGNLIGWDQQLGEVDQLAVGRRRRRHLDRRRDHAGEYRCRQRVLQDFAPTEGT